MHDDPTLTQHKGNIESHIVIPIHKYIEHNLERMIVPIMVIGNDTLVVIDYLVRHCEMSVYMYVKNDMALSMLCMWVWI